MNTYNRGPEFEVASQRQYVRLKTPLQVRIGQRIYRAIDWSLSGLKLGGFYYAITPGSTSVVYVQLIFQGFDMGFSVPVVVHRSDATSGELALEFLDMDNRQRELLRYFGDQFQMGRMAHVGDVIKRIDIPVTPPSEAVDDNSNAQRRQKSTRKAWYMAGIYAVLGLMLTTALIAGLYGRLFRLEVNTAVIGSPVESIVANERGVIESLLVEEGDSVAEGQPLVRVSNSAVQNQLDLARLQLREVELQRGEAEALLESGRNEWAIYKTLAEDRYGAAEGALRSARERLRQAESDLGRKRELHNKELISTRELEEAISTHRLAQASIASAESAFSLAGTVVRSAHEGRYFSEHRQEFNFDKHVADVHSLRSREEIERQKVALLERQRDTGLIKAPYDARVLSIGKSSGNTVAPSDRLLTLERASEPLVHAYLTQQELLSVREGSRALVYVPSQGRYLDASVTMVETLSEVVDEIRSRFEWFTEKERNGHVVLRLTSGNDDEVRHLAGGLPVVVNFKRHASNRVLEEVIAFMSGDSKPPVAAVRGVGVARTE